MELTRQDKWTEEQEATGDRYIGSSGAHHLVNEDDSFEPDRETEDYEQYHTWPA